MKSLRAVTLLLAGAAVALSLYTLTGRPKEGQFHYPEVAVAPEPKTLVVRVLQRPRWDGTHTFFAKHSEELISNVEVANFLENKGIGIAFVRTVGGNKRFQLCQWMRKTDVGWEEVPYLSSPLSGEPFRGKWIQGNKEWLEEMDSKRENWEKESDSAW